MFIRGEKHQVLSAQQATVRAKPQVESKVIKFRTRLLRYVPRVSLRNASMHLTSTKCLGDTRVQHSQPENNQLELSLAREGCRTLLSEGQREGKRVFCADFSSSTIQHIHGRCQTSGSLGAIFKVMMSWSKVKRSASTKTFWSVTSQKGAHEGGDVHFIDVVHQ